MRRAFIATLVAAFYAASPVFAQTVVPGGIAGTVTDSTGEPLAGATVIAIGTGYRATVRSNGQYTLTTPPGTYQVRAALLGYAPLVVPNVVVRAGESATANFRLIRRAAQLSAVVVSVGYGTQRRQDVTGAIGSVNVDQIATVPTSSSVGQLIQGRVAGAQVVQNNGAPGSGISIRVRGSNSVTANSEPLYVIDGVPAYVGNGGTDPYQNPLASLSPEDIQAIDVLKDASATAIYGTRGANGVILVTTKLGRRGENHVGVESNVGMQSPARYIPMLNGQQFALLANDAKANAGQKPVYTDAQLAAIGTGTDWQRQILRSAASQSHTLNFSGGDDRTRYYVSGTYFDQDGVIRGTAFRRYSGRANLDRTISSRLHVGTNLTLSNVNSALQITDNVLGNATVMGALWFNPVSPVRDSTGAYIQNSPVTFPVQNPVPFVNDLQNSRSLFTLLGNFFGEYQFTDNLKFRGSLGTTSTFDRTRFYAPRTTAIGLSTNGTGNESSGTRFNVVNENILTYARPVRGSDNLDITAGFTAQVDRGESLSAANQQFVTDATGVYDLGAGTMPTANSDYSKWGLLSYLGRVNYNLLDRYLFTASGRYDGSSRLGKNNKWAFFPSGAFAWRVIQEPWFRNQRIFSDFKLRFGYGVTGNQEIGLYQSLARLGTRTYSFGGNTVIGYFPAGAAPNPDLKWETTKQANTGLDLGFFHGRVTTSVDVYNSVTSDLLLSVTLPSTTGFTSQLRNVGSVRNTGVEVSLGTDIVQRRNVNWHSTLSYAHNRNRVLNLGVANEIVGPDKGIGTQTGGTTVVIRKGEPIGSFVGFRTNGIFQQGDACALTVKRPQLDCVPGEYRYVDANGDGQINGNDRVLLGNGQPDYYGGLQNDVNVGPFRLNVFLQGSHGGKVLNAPAINIRQVNINSNQTADALRRWTPTNTNTDIPRANSLRPREIYDIHVEDASFVRLQSVTLGYELPTRLLRGSNSARIYVTGENLHLWTKYKGYDPEVNSFGGNAISRGIDLGAYPRPRSYTAGISLGF